MALRAFLGSILIGVSVLFSLSMGLSSNVQAADQKNEQSKNIKKDEDVFFRLNLVVPPTDASSVVAIGKSVIVPTEIEGQLLALGEDVDVSTTIQDDTLVVSKKLSLDGTIKGDLNFEGRTLYTDSESLIQGDAKIDAHKAFLKGNIDGDLYVKAHRITINGVINGDVYIDADKIIIGKEARIEGQLYYPKDAALRIEEGGYISSKNFLSSQEKVTLLNALQAQQNMGQKFFQAKKGLDFLTKYDDSISWLRTVFWGIILFVIGYLLFRRFPLFMQRTAIPSSAMPFVGIMLQGVIGLVAIPIAIFFLMITIIGIPVALLLLLAYILYLFLSKVVGIWILSQKAWYGMKGNVQESAQRYSLIAFLIGIIVIMSISALPIIGWLIGFLVLLLGSGTLWIRLFNRNGFKPSFEKLPAKPL